MWSHKYVWPACGFQKHICIWEVERDRERRERARSCWLGHFPDGHSSQDPSCQCGPPGCLRVPSSCTFVNCFLGQVKTELDKKAKRHSNLGCWCHKQWLNACRHQNFKLRKFYPLGFFFPCEYSFRSKALSLNYVIFVFCISLVWKPLLKCKLPSVE